MKIYNFSHVLNNPNQAYITIETGMWFWKNIERKKVYKKGMCWDVGSNENAFRVAMLESYHYNTLKNKGIDYGQ